MQYQAKHSAAKIPMETKQAWFAAKATFRYLLYPNSGQVIMILQPYQVNDSILQDSRTWSVIAVTAELYIRKLGLRQANQPDFQELEKQSVPFGVGLS